jgi:hypothetical protein
MMHIDPVLSHNPAVRPDVGGFDSIINNITWKTDNALSSLDTIPSHLDCRAIFDPRWAAKWRNAKEVFDAICECNTWSVDDEHWQRLKAGI